MLLLLADTPTFGYRPKEMKNGLSMPPRMSLGNIVQIVSCPLTQVMEQVGCERPDQLRSHRVV